MDEVTRFVLEQAWEEGYAARQAEEESEYVQYGSVFREYIENPYSKKGGLMHLTVSIRLDDGQIVSARYKLESLDDEEVSFVAKKATLRAQEEAFMVLAEGE
jgi:hypothetical protein